MLDGTHHVAAVAAVAKRLRSCASHLLEEGWLLRGFSAVLQPFEYYDNHNLLQTGLAEHCSGISR